MTKRPEDLGDKALRERCRQLKLECEGSRREIIERIRMREEVKREPLPTYEGSLADFPDIDELAEDLAYVVERVVHRALGLSLSIEENDVYPPDIFYHGKRDWPLGGSYLLLYPEENVIMAVFAFTFYNDGRDLRKLANILITITNYGLQRLSAEIYKALERERRILGEVSLTISNVSAKIEHPAGRLRDLAHKYGDAVALIVSAEFGYSNEGGREEI